MPILRGLGSSFPKIEAQRLAFSIYANQALLRSQGANARRLPVSAVESLVVRGDVKTLSAHLAALNLQLAQKDVAGTKGTVSATGVKGSGGGPIILEIGRPKKGKIWTIHRAEVTMRHGPRPAEAGVFVYTYRVPIAGVPNLGDGDILAEILNTREPMRSGTHAGGPPNLADPAKTINWSAPIPIDQDIRLAMSYIGHPDDEFSCKVDYVESAPGWTQVNIFKASHPGGTGSVVLGGPGFNTGWLLLKAELNIQRDKANFHSTASIKSWSGTVIDCSAPHAGVSNNNATAGYSPYGTGPDGRNHWNGLYYMWAGDRLTLHYNTSPKDKLVWTVQAVQMSTLVGPT